MVSTGPDQFPGQYTCITCGNADKNGDRLDTVQCRLIGANLDSLSTGLDSVRPCGKLCDVDTEGRMAVALVAGEEHLSLPVTLINSGAGEMVIKPGQMGWTPDQRPVTIAEQLIYNAVNKYGRHPGVRLRRVQEQITELMAKLFLDRGL